MAEKKEVDPLLTNYIRLQALAHKGKKPLKQVFIKQWNLSSEDKWKDSKTNRQTFIDGPGKTLFKNLPRIQKEHLKSRSIDDWNLQLLISAVKCLNADIPYKVYDKLKVLRNKVSSLGEAKVCNKEFEDYWKRISSLLLQLGITQEEIDEVKSLPVGTAVDESPEVPKVAEVQEMKEEGNKAFKNEQYEKSTEFYTTAISNPNACNKELALLYSNR